MIEVVHIEALNKAAGELDGVDAPWAICGGWAIDLFLDKVTRPHKDIDFSIRRCDQLLFQRHLVERGWTLEVAEDGLHPWKPKDHLELPAHTIWCRRGDEFLELLFDEWDDSLFRFRKKQTITMPADQATVAAASGFKILAPEIVLLYKSFDRKNRDYQSDFVHAYPRLTESSQRWLRNGLIEIHGSHPWLEEEQSEGKNNEASADQEGGLGGR